MTEQYRWSSIKEDDVESWAELTNHLAAVDGTEEFHSAEDRLEELQDAHTDPATDTVAVWHGEQMVGFGTVSVKLNPDREGRAGVGLDGGVHADHRRRGIGAELMTRLEARGRESVSEKHPDRAYHFSTGGGRHGSSARAFHLGRGYEVARYFNLMGRALATDDSAQTILGRPMPSSMVIRAPQPQDDKAVFDAHAAAFVDHWGSAPPVASVWHEQWTSRSARPGVSRIAVDPSGTVLAYVLCGQWVPRELYVNLVGTIPEARGQGLGSALLATTVEAAASSGDYDAIDLDVDSESPTGATRIYERLGFTIKHTTALMRKHPS